MSDRKLNTKKFEHLYRYCDVDTPKTKGVLYTQAENAVPCVVPTLIISVQNTPFNIKSKEEFSPFIIFFELFKKYLGNQITSHYTGKGKAIKPKNLDWFREQFDNAKHKELKKKNLIGYKVWFNYQCSASQLPHGIMQPPSFDSCVNIDLEYRKIAMRIDLPIDFLEIYSEKYFQELIYDLLNNYPIDLGYVGYSFLFDNSAHTADLKPYIDWSKLHFENKGFLPSNYLTQGLRSIGWITLIGEQHFDKFGGKTKIENFFSKDKDILIHHFKYGIGLQVGDKPVAGNDSDDMGLYKKVYKYLLPILNKEHSFYGIGSYELVGAL